MIYDQTNLVSSTAGQGMLLPRMVGGLLTALGFGMAVTLPVLSDLRGDFPGWGPMLAVVIPAVAVGSIGIAFLVGKPLCAARVKINDTSVVFEGGTNRTWSIRWDDPRFALRCYLKAPQPSVIGITPSPVFVMGARGGRFSSLVTTEVYETVVRQATAHGLRIETIQLDWGAAKRFPGTSGPYSIMTLIRRKS